MVSVVRTKRENPEDEEDSVVVESSGPGRMDSPTDINDN